MQVSESFARVIRAAAVAALLIALGSVASAQGSGTVGIQTVNIPVFTSQSTTASSGGYWQCSSPTASGACPVLQDSGFAANFLTFCTSGFVGSINLEWSPSNSVFNFKPLSTATYSVADSSCHTMQVGGYFPNLRSTVTVTSGSLSAWYTASASPIALFSAGIGSNGPTSPIICDHATYVGATSGAGATFLVGPINSGDSLIVCGFTVSFNGTTGSGNVELGFAVNSSCGGTFVQTWNSFTTASTPQFLSIPLQQRSNSPNQQNVCITNTSGATADVSVSWASVHL